MKNNNIKTMKIKLSKVSRADTVNATCRHAEELLNELGWHEESLPYILWRSMVSWAHWSFLLDETAESWPNNVPPQGVYRHTMRFRNEPMARAFAAEVPSALPSASAIEVEQLAETLSDCEITLKLEVALCSASLTKVSARLQHLAWEFGGEYVDREPLCRTENTVEAPTSAPIAHRPNDSARRQLKMRAEFLKDAVLARSVLAPWVLKWSDISSLYEDSGGQQDLVDGLDCTVTFEVSNDAPCLDHLRWLLNQVAELHVAAESLDYADKYSGRRLPYELVRRIKPSDAVLKQIARRQAAVVNCYADDGERLSSMAETLKSLAK